MKFYRNEAAWTALGETKSPYYDKIARGLLPRPIKIGARAAGLPDFEVDAVIAARVSGASDDEMKDLVDRLHARRAAMKDAALSV